MEFSVLRKGRRLPFEEVDSNITVRTVSEKGGQFLRTGDEGGTEGNR